MVELELNVWLKAEDIGTESTVIFENEGENAEILQGEGVPPVQSFEISVMLPNNESKIWTMNKTSQRAVAQTYGLDTKQWIGKPVVVFVTDQNVRGTMKKVIYARIPAAAVVEERVV